MSANEGVGPPAASKVADPAFAPLDMTASRQFVNWLAEQRVSLAFTTYQAGFLVFVGRTADGRLAHHRRGLTRRMGMVAHAAACMSALSTRSGASRTRLPRDSCTKVTTGSTCHD